MTPNPNTEYKNMTVIHTHLKDGAQKKTVFGPMEEMFQ